ncbi:MAG: tetratricopeptide repeat protein [Chthoniobacterales bacterium]
MAVETEKDLDETARGHWLKAVAAVELRNFGYAISLLQAVLKEHPRFLTARQLLRRTEITRFRAKRKSLFSISTASLAVMKAQRELKRDPARTIELVEKIVEKEPFNRQANLILKEAAVAGGWPEIGVLALETLLEEKPDDTKVLHELGRVYALMGESGKAVDIYNRITEIDPLDAEAVRCGKDAAARGSMTSGGWTQAASYRDLIQDKEAAVSREQQSRMQLTGESLDQQIADTYERHQSEPGNIELARRLGLLHEQKDDLENALGWLRYAAELTNGTDSGLTRRISDLQMKVADRQIAELEESLETEAPEDSRRTALAAAKQQRAELAVNDARERAERNPTDLQLRFELGEELVNAGRFREAVAELQRARQNPHARLRAMNLLGRCYRELGMLDLAARQLQEAAREIGTMDAMKKAIVYELGTVYERMGDSEKSIACMKEIYEADYGYRDVAVRVEQSYNSGSGNQPH